MTLPAGGRAALAHRLLDHGVGAPAGDREQGGLDSFALGRRTPTPSWFGSALSTGDEVWVTTGDAWWRNLRSNPLAHVWLAGRQVVGDATLVTDAQESVHSNTTMFEARPFFARLAGLPTRPGRPQIARAVDAGRVLVRIKLRAPDSTVTGYVSRPS